MKSDLLPATLQSYIKERIAEFISISKPRKEILTEVAKYIERELKTEGSVDLLFICTHNSRRSHMSQLWAQVASFCYHINGINCYSGGTETSAFNPRAVHAMRQAGFHLEQMDTTQNPVYRVSYCDAGPDTIAFSKKFTDAPNPGEGFIAVMTCSDADEACPHVPGASARYSITYEDPREADHTPKESMLYNERCKQIAREMLFLVSNITLSDP